MVHMRVVIDARLFGTKHRGIGRYLRELIRAELSQDNSLELVLLVESLDNPELAEIKNKVMLVLAPWRVYTLAEQIHIPSLLRKLKPDLVHFPHFNVPLAPLPPYVVTIHDLLIHQFPNERATTKHAFVYKLKVLGYKLIVRRALSRAKKIFTVSHDTARAVTALYPWSIEKIVVTPLAPVPLSAQSASFIEPPKPFVLVVGAAYPHKNLERTVEAVVRARQTVPELNLVVVGKQDFFMNRFLRWVEQQGFSKVVQYMGEVDDGTLSKLYHSATFYILPSLNEGFGLGAVEALANGCLVIASDIPVLHEVLGGAAIFADPYSIKDLAGAMITLTTDESNLRAGLKTRTETVLQRYSWSVTAQKTLLAYNQAIARS